MNKFRIDYSYIASLFISIAVALLIGALLILATGHSPGEGYGAMIEGVFGNSRVFGNTVAKSMNLCLTALAMAVAAKAGMFNVGGEGQLYLGGLAATMVGVIMSSASPIIVIPLAIVAVSFAMANALMGVFAAVMCGIVIGIFFAVFVVKLRSDEFIIGMALNTFAAGTTVFLLRSIFGVKGTFADKGIIPLPSVNLPWLESIPVIGPLLNGHSVFVYITWVFVFLVWFLLYKTPYGFWIRAAGEHPESLATAGINPDKMKFIASILCGILCGFAGAHLSLGYLTMFAEGMSANRGFIAFACVIFGMANPPRVFLAALLFGFLNALGLRLQSVGIPPDITAMTPYVVTVLMLVYIVTAGEAKRRRRAKRLVAEQKT